jgi:sulfite exporter TauE/SafE
MGLIPALKPDSFPGLKRFSRMMNNLLQQVRVGNIFLLGMAIGFIPCGLVYAMGARAAATESMFGGMLTMIVFGAGTTFAMTLAGFMAGLLSLKQRRWLYRAAAALVIALGIMTLWHGLHSIIK